MRTKSARRLEAERLRTEEGLSYNEIAARTGISKSTLSSWLEDVPLTPEQEARLQARLRANRAAFAARALPVNRNRWQQKRERAYQAGASVVARLPDDASVDELALAMLYLGEGSKSGNRVQLASTDPAILRFFLWALKNLYRIDEERLSFRLNLIEAARSDEATMLSWWNHELGCRTDQFTKTQFDRRSRAVCITGDYRGVCTVTYADTYLQQHILGLARAYVCSHVTLDVEDKTK